jgi:hypothetical protein
MRPVAVVQHYWNSFSLLPLGLKKIGKKNNKSSGAKMRTEAEGK